MFQTFPEHTLRQALENADSVEDAANILLEMGQPAEVDIPSDENTPPPGDSPHQFEDLMDVEDESGDNEVQAVSDLPQKEDEGAKVLGLDDCVVLIVSVFPDVCTDYVKKQYEDNIAAQGDNIVNSILNSLIELGPKRPLAEVSNPRKRKRSIDGLEQSKFEAVDRELLDGYKPIARRLLQREFSLCPVTYIDRVLLQNRFLAQSYAVIKSVYDDPKPPFERLKNPRKLDNDSDTLTRVYCELVEELKYAKKKANLQRNNAQLEADEKLAETLNIEEHEENGMMIECQCCYGESPFSGMTQCNEGHLFCLDCARRNAENEVGRGRYRLLCMAGCKSEFPRREVLRFLDEKLILALEKNEQEEVLRMADLKDLTKCPFCDYAAICAPIDEDKEFRCGNPDCLEISCRHCQQKSHIPQTCEEVSKDGKLSVRHKLEEAMTEALVRTCKKCNNKFIKESGCNKMSCSRCHTLQCYVCSETIKGYDHFNDPSRGGSKTNKCPLFDNTDERHDEEVEKAAKKVMEQLKEENPHVTDEDLEIKLSEAVKNKKATTPWPRGPRMAPGGDMAMLAFLPPRLNPPAIPPIQHPIPPAQPVFPPVLPPAPPDVMVAREAQLKAFREVREGLRRNALHMNVLQEALQANLAQPGRQDRARHQAAAAAAAAQQVAAQQAAPTPPFLVRRRTLPVNLAQGAAGRINPNHAMGRQQRAPPQTNPFPALAAQQQVTGIPGNQIQAPAAQPAQPVPLPNRLRRNAAVPAAVAPPPANPIAPWQAANPPVPGNNFPDLRNANARLQELHQRWQGAYGNYSFMYPGQAAATKGDGQAAAIPGGIPAAGPNSAPNPPAAGGAPPMEYLRRRRG